MANMELHIPFLHNMDGVVDSKANPYMECLGMDYPYMEASYLPADMDFQKEQLEGLGMVLVFLQELLILPYTLLENVEYILLLEVQIYFYLRLWPGLTSNPLSSSYIRPSSSSFMKLLGLILCVEA